MPPRHSILTADTRRSTAESTQFQLNHLEAMLPKTGIPYHEEKKRSSANSIPPSSNQSIPPSDPPWSFQNNNSSSNFKDNREKKPKFPKTASQKSVVSKTDTDTDTSAFLRQAVIDEAKEVQMIMYQWLRKKNIEHRNWKIIEQSLIGSIAAIAILLMAIPEFSQILNRVFTIYAAVVTAISLWISLVDKRGTATQQATETQSHITHLEQIERRANGNEFANSDLDNIFLRLQQYSRPWKLGNQNTQNFDKLLDVETFQSE